MTARIAMALLATLTTGCTAAAASDAATPFSRLAATWRHGQVFLTWAEAALPAGSTVSVYTHTQPITAATLSQARRLAAQIDVHSARDWWQDPASFSPDAVAGAPVGWTIAAGGAPLDPDGGLFVHTVAPDTAGRRYYAVTWCSPEGQECRNVQAGANATTMPLEVAVGPPQPVWQTPGAGLPAEGSCAGRRLLLSLHGRGGGTTAGPGASSVNCLWFGDSTQGWREGLPFKFALSVQADTVVITPMDRVWIGRPVTESKDRRDHCPAINTWWFGYNEMIRTTTLTNPVSAPNYTERYLLALVGWAQRYLGCDPKATYVKGGSMGGSGSVALALHFPAVFAAAHALVPVYSCTRPGRGSATRLECMCGPLEGKRAVTVGDVAILDYLNGAACLRAATVDIPPIFATNGRQDGSIPWENNPPFYAAANESRQAFAVYWNNGAHGMSDETPADVKAWGSALYAYRLDCSYPVFTDSSDNRDYGAGDPAVGDLEGWINRGLTWDGLDETAERYALTVIAVYPGIKYPLTVSVTPRRLQRFKPAPGEVLVVTAADQPAGNITVEPSGQFTTPRITVSDAAGTRVVIRRR